tara:strand:+ start:6519 stop:6986 length:468 start_codon:yes stop_codon:yes gene_type:complete
MKFNILLTATLLATIWTGSASAAVDYVSSPQACVASNETQAELFNYKPGQVLNESDRDLYLRCMMTHLMSNTYYDASIRLVNPTSSSVDTVCVLREYDQNGDIVQSDVETATLTASASTGLDMGLTGIAANSFVTVTCKIPPGIAMAGVYQTLLE